MCRSGINRPANIDLSKKIIEVMSADSLSVPFKESFILAQEDIVDSILSTLSEKEKIHQLFMPGVYPTRGESEKQRIIDLIKEKKIGGLIFFKGDASTIATWINAFQEVSEIPLLISIDGEWGVSMRIKQAMKFPRQLMLGAIQNDGLLYELGRQVAMECKQLGIHINFAPVVDVNNNPDNPVINDRSFGEDRVNVTQKSIAYMRGMQDNGIIACAKHFPGHGDTDVDSHKDLPVINHDMHRLDSIELYPFRSLIHAGIKSVMVAHLHIPTIDSSRHLPITLSKKGVNDLLIDSLGFNGLVITDALNMKGVTKHFQDGLTDLKAYLAGNDILLVSQDIEQATSRIQKAIQDSLTTISSLDERVRKILRAKHAVGLFQSDSSEIVGKPNLISNESRVLKRMLIDQSITLVKNDISVPLDRAVRQKTSIISFGVTEKTPFQTSMKKYCKGRILSSPSILDRNKLDQIRDDSLLIVGFHAMSRYRKKGYGIDLSVIKQLRELRKNTNILIVLFGSPYALEYFEGFKNIVVSYNDDPYTQLATAQALTGGLSFSGRLPISASPSFRFNMGQTTKSNRLPYATNPEKLGMSSKVLNEIDKITDEMIQSKASPGCQVMVVKDGMVAYHKAFGHHDYMQKVPVRLDDVYDVASVTKIAATTISIMKLYDERRISLTDWLGDYIPMLKGSNKEKLRIADVMAHEARLKAWIPFYINTLDSTNRPDPIFYAKTKTENYNYEVTDSLFFDKAKVDSVVWRAIIDSPLRRRSGYKYSDLGFYLLPKLIETIVKMPFEQYVRETFYEPMGLSITGFNPLRRGLKRDRIIPTDVDTYFRYDTIQGHVHDMGAAMLDGVSGHAGLFSTAMELGMILQMLLNEGFYDGRQYISKETIWQFTRQFNPSSRRGIGFDRKEPCEKDKSVNVAWQASDNTFGHQGFTGIGVWADPDEKLIYIFLSNRTFPQMDNMTLIRKDIRSRIQEVVYRSLIKNTVE